MNIFCLFLLVTISCQPSIIFPLSLQTAPIRRSEEVLRKSAINIVMPKYPEKSWKNGKKGTAVAKLEIDENGKVTNVEVLQAPDKDISEEVSSAVWRWTFRSTTIDHKPQKVIGKLTFFFIIDGKDIRVENPSGSGE